MRNDIFSALGSVFTANLFGNNSNKQGEIVKRIVSVDSKNFTYQLYLPNQIEETKNLPVIVFLHGIRERGSGGFVPEEGPMGRFLKQYLKQVPAIIIFPQCRPESYWSDPFMEQMVLESIGQTIDEFNADEKSVYLIGISMGGYGVWHFAMQKPEKFAALVSICGGSSILSGERFEPLARKVGKTPAWLFHGAVDKIVPVSESRAIVNALRENNGNVKYNEYEDAGHNVWMNVLGEKDLLKWLLDNRLE